MQNENKKILRWFVVGGTVCFLLAFIEIIIAQVISNNNDELFCFYGKSMLLITMFIFLLISIIKYVKYQRFVKKYKNEKVEKAKEKLSTEFKEVYLNYSDPIPQKFFQCEAKIGEDGKIICKVKLDYEVKIDYEKFLRHFHFDQE